jgi:hypothetical protein
MKKLLIVLVFILVGLFLIGIGGNSEKPKGEYLQEDFAFVPIPVYINGHIGSDQYGTRLGPVFSCWILGKYWYDTEMRSSFVFNGEFGRNVTNGKCEGVSP